MIVYNTKIWNDRTKICVDRGDESLIAHKENIKGVNIVMENIFNAYKKEWGAVNAQSIEKNSKVDSQMFFLINKVTSENTKK